MAETPIRFAKGSAVWCQTTPVNYHDAVVLEDCVEGDAEAVVRYTTAARVMRVPERCGTKTNRLQLSYASSLERNALRVSVMPSYEPAKESSSALLFAERTH